MDDSAKELLKHIQGLIAASENKVTSHLSSRSHAVERLVESLAQDFQAWRPHLEARVDGLQEAVTELQRHANLKQPLGASTVSNGGGPAAHLADARGANLPPLLSRPPIGADLGQGHGESLQNRGVMPADPAAPVFTPVKGTQNFQTPLHLRLAQPDSEASASNFLAHMSPTNPSLQFPVFDGDNPQMWQVLAEEYFSMFAIHDSYWVSMAILNFSGSPKAWLHSVRRKLAALDWTSFCALLCTRFGRDKHQLLIRKFYTLKQTDTVANYIESLSIL
jgi:hypothetical protein